MNAVVIGLAAALAACVAVAVWLSRLLAERPAEPADARLDAVVEALESRMAELSRELNDAVGRAEEEGRRNRFLAQIASSLELEDVLGSTLEAALTLEHVDAALVHVDGEENGRLSWP